MDGLSMIVKEHFKLDPFVPGILFLFCGRRSSRIKGLLWEEDGLLLLYKRLEAGRFQ
ncbi:IS66 family insertion sequence element accessory protein TnpB [Lacrimispora sp. 38-1]|uniref:IS66 family insertion sequence element accessory protein TnpB n=1 Tax=Lacrimispora sp. 38-1 TaxID=3125778 RepID=UPI003CED226D